MNGRMYDAQQGRFLSPDNHIQDPFNTQNFNRFGYVLNNPLSLTDPSGEFWFIVAIIAGAYIGGAQANGSWNPLKWDWNSSSTWLGIVGGAAIGAVSFGIGTAVAGAVAPILSAAGIPGGILGGALVGAASGTVAGAFAGGFTAMLPGGSGKFFQGVWQGAKAGFIGGFVVGGVVGGLTTPKGHNILTGQALRPTAESISSLKPNGVQEAGPKNKPTAEKPLTGNNNSTPEILEPKYGQSKRPDGASSWGRKSFTPDDLLSLADGGKRLPGGEFQKSLSLSKNTFNSLKSDLSIYQTGISKTGGPVWNFGNNFHASIYTSTSTNITTLHVNAGRVYKIRLNITN